MLNDDRVAEASNPYDPPEADTAGADRESPLEHTRNEAPLVGVVLLIPLAIAFYVGTIVGSVAWFALYPHEKDPQLELFWGRAAGIALGVALCALFHKRLRRPSLLTGSIAVFAAVGLGIGSSLAGICWAIWLRVM
jgi:hypothetical protein